MSIKFFSSADFFFLSGIFCDVHCLIVSSIIVCAWCICFLFGIHKYDMSDGHLMCMYIWEKGFYHANFKKYLFLMPLGRFNQPSTVLY